ncbi:hypothetical protein GGQ95_003764, partial [Anoxybacillus rupiensis]|nr:hypothetical protein [Anoxybacillus rupiensis]
DNADDIAAVVRHIVERVTVLVCDRVWLAIRPRKHPYGLAVVVGNAD